MQFFSNSYSLFLIFCLSFLLASPLLANVPPPPANQLIGINDSLFNDMDEAQCRVCHGTDENVERHHLLYNTEIPDPTDAPYGVPGELYSCVSCHEMDTSSGVIEFLIERDCTACHIQSSSFELSVHHRTDEALGNPPLDGPDCQACHGSLVDNINDGHYIPDYPPTAETPAPSGGDGLPLNSEGNGAGACDYCHSTGTGDPTIPGIDDASGVVVYSNEDLHHETGFWGGVGAHGFVCFWCHDQTLPLEEPPIRLCENCHGPDSLHNIQTDSNGDGSITPGVELPGYGHIGNPDDCWGCHGYSTAPAPGTGSITPYITGTNLNIITAGIDTQVTFTGSSFTNFDGPAELTSDLVLKADDGTETTLAADTISAGFLTATLPETLPTGNYRTRAVKGSASSNPIVLSIIPPVVITAVDCNEAFGTLIITGTGFGDPPPEGSEEYLNVMLGNTLVESTMWSDTHIQALVSSCTGGVTVNALYGSAAFCDCEGNFDGDSDVDGSDTYLFKVDFGRSMLLNPCSGTDSCNGDFDCDQDVDGSDAVIMKGDFGRSALHNPCSSCTVDEWCSY